MLRRDGFVAALPSSEFVVHLNLSHLPLSRSGNSSCIGLSRMRMSLPSFVSSGWGTTRLNGNGTLGVPVVGIVMPYRMGVVTSGREIARLTDVMSSAPERI